MATVFESIPTESIRRADLKQLLDVVKLHQENGDYWGNKKQHYERNERIIEWLESNVEYAYSEGVVMPKS
jgi:hypothetical protein